jgi:outer membrane protein
LEECIDYAIVHNIRVQLTELQSQGAVVKKDMAFGQFLPVVSGNAQHSWTIGDGIDLSSKEIINQTNQLTTFGLSANVTIYQGMQLQNKMVRARLEYLSSVYQVQKIKEDIALNVINSYLQIIFTKELVKTNQVQLEYDKEDEIRTTQLVQAGVVPAGDLLDVKANVANSNQRLILAQNELVMAKLNLAQLLQIKDFEFFDVIDSDYSIVPSKMLLENPKDIAVSAAEKLTTIKTAELNVEMAKKDLQIVKGTYLPTIQGFYSLGSTVNYQNRIVGNVIDNNIPNVVIGNVEGTNQRVLAPNYTGVTSGPEAFFTQFSNQLNSNFGLRLSLPIFQGFAVKNNVKLNQLTLKQRISEKEVANLELEQQVYKAYTDTQSAYKAYEASNITLESRQTSLEYARERYKAGLISIFDLNQNQNLYVTAQSNLLKAKYDYIFKNKILEYYFGVPLFRN